jgi:RNA polymerase sigma-70 factor (ECF subfamily)
MIEPQDQAISLEKLRAGDRSEFARLVEAYSTQIYRMALRMLPSEQDAEDVLQETFIKVMNGIKHFQERSNLSTWIYRIAVNEALMMLRKGKRIAGSLDDQIDIDEPNEGMEPKEIIDWCCLPEESFIEEEVKNKLEEAIHSLPDKYRLVFILRDLENLPIKDTATVLGITEMSVKTRLLRARLQLREMLSIYFSERMVE